MPRGSSGTPWDYGAVKTSCQGPMVPGAREHYEEEAATARHAGESALAAVANLGDLALARGDFETALARSLEARELARAKGGLASEGDFVAHYNAGAALVLLGRIEEARPMFRYALEGFIDTGATQGLAWCAIGVAAIAGQVGAHEDAVRLLDFADALLDECGAHLEASDQRLHDAATAAAGEAVVAQMHQEAGRLSREQAFDLALRYLS